MKIKVLLMGKSGSGKTSMRSIIFANYIPNDTKQLGPTMEIEHSHVRVFGNIVLNLWDCGGQETFSDNYFGSQREKIFSNVEVLIYVFNGETEDGDYSKDFNYYNICLAALYENSPAAKVFCLIHKMDLLPVDKREKVFGDLENEMINASKPVRVTCLKTSIWDLTLYKTWSSIIHQLIPNINELEKGLKVFTELMEADEVLLFERSTCLILSHWQRSSHLNMQRFEKISNILKRFKLNCSKLATQINSIEVRNSNFAAFINALTINMYIMVVMYDPQISSATTTINIKNARKYFEKLEQTLMHNDNSTNKLD